jgi:flagellar motor component MotA
MNFKGTLGALWAVMILIVGSAVVYGLKTNFDAISKIMVAVIGGAAVLLGAILTHVLAGLREQQQALQRQKQENYKALVEKLTPFVRNPKRQIDDFTATYLQAWVIGDPDVVKMAALFMESPGEKELTQLLNAIRQDIGLAESDAKLGPILGPVDPEPTPGALKSTTKQQ